MFASNRESRVNREQKREHFFINSAAIAAKATLRTTLLRSRKYSLDLYFSREYQVSRTLLQSYKTAVIDKNKDYNSSFIPDYAQRSDAIEDPK